MPAPAREAVVALPRARWLELAAFLPSGRALLVGFASLAVVAGGYALARETSMFAVERIEVRGTDAIGAAEVRRALAGMKGTSLLAVGAGDVSRRLEELPDVIGASYDRDFPHTLRVFVVPEEPVAVLRRGADAWLVSARGRLLRRVTRGTLRALPRVWGPRGGEERLGDRVDGRAAAMVAALASARSVPLPSGVRGATFEPGHGLTLLLHDGLEVRLGAPARIALKLAVAQRIVPLAPAGTAVVDVSVPERPVSSDSQVGG